MGFELLKQQMAESAFQILGSDAFYTSRVTGATLKARVVIRRGFEINPGALLTGISEKITVCDFLYSQVSDPRGGDTVTVGTDEYTVDNEIENDHITVRVSLK